jgi:hypothetical protein
MKTVSNKEIAAVFKEAKKYLAKSESDSENVSKRNLFVRTGSNQFIQVGN